MNENKQNFLATENVGWLMQRYAIPCIISLLVGALYNIVDQIFIANASYLGSYGNAANTVVFPLTVIALAMAVMIGDGCCAFVSISLGRSEEKEAKKSVGNSVLMILASSLVLTAIYLIFSKQIIAMFGGTVNAETFKHSREYFFYISLGIPFYMFGQAMNPIIRADGNPKFAMVSTLAGAVLNIILDPIFIFIFKWGMMGAALATVIGQVVTALLAIWYLCSMKHIKPAKSDFAINTQICGKTLVLGICSFLSQISLVAAMAAINNMIRKYGAMDAIFGQEQYAQIPMAVVGIVMKFFQIVISIVVGMAAGCIPVVGFNMGAGLKHRVKDLFTRLLICEASVGLIALIIVEFFPGQLINIFGAANESIYYTEFALRAFRIYLSMMIFACVNKACFIFLQAMGKAAASTALSMIREVVFGVGFALLLPLIFGLDGVLYSMPLSDILTFVIALYLIRRTYKELGVSAAADGASVMEQAEIRPSRPGLIITIAREHGSSGKQIGKLLAEKLGIPFYYKETTALAAQESGLAREFITDMNKNSSDVLRNLYMSTNVVQQAILAQDKIIRKIADEGSCVIIGRAADYVLRDYENIVRIFIYAPEEIKIRRVMEIYGDTAEEAKKNVHHSDEARAAYYNAVSGLKWGRAHNYDLLIDSSVGVEKCVEIIAAML